MKTKTKLFGSLLLVATITMTPCTVRSQDLSIPFDDRNYQLIEQIQDLELMRRDIQRCYEVEKRTAMIEHSSTLRRFLPPSVLFEAIEEPAGDRTPAQTPPKWQNRCIIPVKT